MQKDLEAILQATEIPIPIYSDADDQENDAEAFSPQTKWYLETTRKRNSPIHLTIGETLQIINSLDFIRQNNNSNISLKEKITAALDLNQQGNFRYIKGNMAPIERKTKRSSNRGKCHQTFKEISFEYDSQR
jgi:hypothetical protein